MSTRGRLWDQRGGGGTWSAFAKTLLAIALLAAGSGCAGINASELAEFHPLPPQHFEMRATTTLFYPPGIYTWAEGQRLRWLQRYVSLNGICPTGYWLSSRQVAFEYQSPLGYPVDEIVYRGHCAP